MYHFRRDLQNMNYSSLKIPYHITKLVEERAHCRKFYIGKHIITILSKHSRMPVVFYKNICDFATQNADFKRHQGKFQSLPSSTR